MHNKLSENLPLNILICDDDKIAARTLEQALEHNPAVFKVNAAYNLGDANELLQSESFNTIFIDPLALDLEPASKFIFDVRKKWPEIVFVLYIDKITAERQRSEFYRGERRRFSHYYSFDKQTPVSAFTSELEASLSACQFWLSSRMSQENLRRLRQEAEKLSKAKPADTTVHKALEEIRDLIKNMNTKVLDEKKEIQENTVFLPYRFAEDDYVKGLKELLTQNGFEVVTGQSTNTYISKAILDRIKKCEFFLCVMTRHEEKASGTFTTSPWLLEEKGAALAFGKPLVLLVEDGVTDIGGLQGDWQRIHFSSKGFLYAALKAVEQLKSYTGR